MMVKKGLFSVVLLSLFLVSCSNSSVTVENNIQPAIDIKGDESHNHIYGNEWSYDENYHYHECECHAKKNVELHKWDNGKITKEATDEENGNITYTCTVCGKTKNEVIPKTSSIQNGGEYKDDGEDWGESHK